MEGDSVESCTPRKVLKILDANLSCNLRVLGSQLGLRTSHLDEIEILPYRERMIKVLERVKDMQGLSWSLLATVLRKPALKEYAVAFAIERYSSINISTSSSHSESVMRSLSTSTGTSSPEASLTSTIDIQDLELTIPNVVNIIAEISNWQELAIFLGMDATDIDIISNDYEPREYRQRLVEKWFSREPERSWEKLQRALDEVTKRRGSQTSKYSIPSTPTSPMDVETDEGRLLSLHGPLAISTSPMEIVGAESRIKELERRFKNMQIAARKELENKKDAVELVKDELTAIPGQREHLTTFKAIARRKRPFKNLTEFFTHLTYHLWSFIEYQPLEHLIENTCSDKLKERVKVYARDVQIFQENTTISEFLTYRGNLAKKRRIPDSFKKFKTEHNIDPETYTLAQLERLRKKTCIHVKLSDFALQILTITTNCIIVEWMVPEEIVEILSLFYSSEVGQDLLRYHQVESIVIDEKSLHSWVLLASIKSGDYEKATSILREKYTDLDLNCQDYDNGRTVLFYAATSGILDLVEKLIEQGADLNIVDMEGKSSLMIAVEGGHVEVVKLFLKLDYQCDTNIQEKTLGWTALHFACAKGREDIVELLINPVLQTDAQLVDNNGRTAIQIAQENKYDKVVDVLSSEMDFEPATGTATEPGEPDDRVEESKQVSARSSRPRIRKFLLRIPWPQRKKRKKIIEAAKIGSEAEVRRLLDEGEDPDSHENNKSKWTSLLYASHNGHLGVVRLLLEKKANPNWRSADEGYTALNLAGYKGFVEILELLLQYGAEVNATTDVIEQTALQRVCLYTPARYTRAKEPPSERRCEVIQLLLSAGADIKILDEQNRTPLIASSRSGFPGIVKILLEKIKEFPEDEKQKYLDHEMRHSWTALMEASEAGHTEIVRMLLNAGATLKQEKKDKVTALHIAVHHKHAAVVQELVRQPDKEVLNARDHYGMTPLILATKAKNEEIISILLNAGADLDLQTEDADKMTALMYAVKHGARDVIKILIRHKADLLITDAKKRTARDMAKSSAIKRYLYELEQEQRQLATAQKSQSQQVEAT